MSQPRPSPPPSPLLTRRQRQILDTLRRLAAVGAPPPTLDALCAELGLHSRGSMHKHVRALTDAGLVVPMQGRRRGIRLLPAAQSAMPAQQPQLRAAAPSSGADRATEPELPLLGKIAAGHPIEALPQPERIAVPAQLRTARPCYVLVVKGDSMRDAGILDGDHVVIEQRDHARNGDIVVALIDGEEATLKRIEQRPGVTLLHAENPAMPPMAYAPERVRIQGVLVGQMRAYS